MNAQDTQIAAELRAAWDFEWASPRDEIGIEWQTDRVDPRCVSAVAAVMLRARELVNRVHPDS